MPPSAVVGLLPLLWPIGNSQFRRAEGVPSQDRPFGLAL